MDATASGITVVVVEAQPATAAGISAFLAAAGCDVAAVVVDTAQLALVVGSLHPAVIVFDPDLVVFDPTAVGPRDEQTQIASLVAGVVAPMLAFTADLSSSAVHRLLEAGVMGVVPRTASAEALVEAVQVVAGGAQHLHPLAVTAWLHGVHSAARSVGSPGLSTREFRLLELIADGSTNAAIAIRLGVSVSTVKSRLEHVYTTLGASDRAHAVSIALRRGLIR